LTLWLAADRKIEQIVEDFEFFPALHAIMATRPNVTPICVTTGVGPHGSETLLIQEPSDNERGTDGSTETADTVFAEDFDFSQFAPGQELTGRSPMSFLEELAEVTGTWDEANNAANMEHPETMGFNIPQLGEVPGSVVLEDIDKGDRSAVSIVAPSMQTQMENRPSHSTQHQAKGALGNHTKSVRPPKPSQMLAKARDKKKGAGKHRRQRATLEDNLLGSIRYVH
jgi:hypothetical protein